MEDLIKALQIFLKYGNNDYPTHCEHDTLHVCGYDPTLMSQEDLDELEKLGFRWSSEYDNFISYRYGSC